MICCSRLGSDAKTQAPTIERFKTTSMEQDNKRVLGKSKTLIETWK